MCITILIVINVTSVIKIVSKSQGIDILHGYVETGAYQIANTLHSAKYISFGDTLTYVSNDTEFTISLHENRIVKQPGFTIFVSDVDAVNFYYSDTLIYMDVLMEGYQSSFLIGTNYECEMEEEENTEAG